MKTIQEIETEIAKTLQKEFTKNELKIWVLGGSRR